MVDVTAGLGRGGGAQARPSSLCAPWRGSWPSSARSSSPARPRSAPTRASRASIAPGLGASASIAAADAQPSSIIVVRREGGRDALWRVAPTDGSATKLVDLTFRPSRIEASPDGARLALLPTAIGPRVYVCDVANATVKALSLAARGVRSVDSFTWLSSTRLLVAGSRERHARGLPLERQALLPQRRHGRLGLVPRPARHGAVGGPGRGQARLRPPGRRRARPERARLAPGQREAGLAQARLGDHTDG